MEPATGAIRPIAPALEGSVDHAWTPDGTLLMARGSVLYRWEPGEAGGWRPVEDLAGRGLASITRLAVSPDGGKIALVREREDP